MIFCAEGRKSDGAAESACRTPGLALSQTPVCPEPEPEPQRPVVSGRTPQLLPRNGQTVPACVLLQFFQPVPGRGQTEPKQLPQQPSAAAVQMSRGGGGESEEGNVKLCL